MKKISYCTRWDLNRLLEVWKGGCDEKVERDLHEWQAW
jgi:hypothetical protein